MNILKKKKKRGKEEAGECAHVLVSSSDGKENAGLNNGGCGLVRGCRVSAAQAHVHDRFGGTAIALSIVDGPFHSGDDARVGTTSGTVKDLDSDKAGFLSNTITGTSNGSGNVSSVTIAVGISAIGSVGSPNSSAAKIGMADLNASINNIGGHA